MIGYPAVENSAIVNVGGTTGFSAATSSSDDILVLADFSNYAVVDRVGTLSVFNPVVIGSNRRPTGEVGVAIYWRVGAGFTDGDVSARLLRV